MKNISHTLVYFLLSAVHVFAQEPATSNMTLADKMAGFEKLAFQQRRQALLREASVASGNFSVHFYRCEWQVDPAVRYLSGKVAAYFRINAAADSITFDLHAALTVDSVVFHGNRLFFNHTANHALTIRFPQTLPLNRQDSVAIFYQGVPPSDGFGSFATAIQNGIPVMWTLSEPYGAKDWWPCKNGLTDKADSIDIILTYPAQYRSASNGLLSYEAVSGNSKTSYWKHRYPIAAYLVAFALTNYAVSTDTARIGAVTLPVRMYAYPADVETFRPQTAIVRQFLQIFSALFGPYPFLRESYSQTQFGWGGGMEHQTNSFVTSNSNELAVHELGHQWFGDKVTCATWQDVWLNEGFGQYMQFIYIENIIPDYKITHLNIYRNLAVSKPGGSVKVSDTTDANRIFDARLSYAKGSFLLHMIRWKLGDSIFFKALRQYLDDPLLAYRNARTEDLQRNLEQVSGQSFERFFREWYEGEGFPSYHLEWSQNSNQWVSLKVNQTTSHPSVSFYEMPLPVEVKGAGHDTIVVLNNTLNGQQFDFQPGFRVDSVIFDPQVRLLSDKNTVTRSGEVAQGGNSVKLFPNPVTNTVNFTIRNPQASKVSILLFDAAGRLLHSEQRELSGRDESVSIPVNGWPRGVYLLRIKGYNIDVSEKILK